MKDREGERDKEPNIFLLERNKEIERKSLHIQIERKENAF